MSNDHANYETVFVRRKFLATTPVDGKPRTSIPEYRIWTGMMARCNNPKNASYRRYGGRGIKICDRWMEDFENFYRDMGPRPTVKHSVDRIDNDGHYEPGNCRWATPREQVLNRTSGHNIWTDAEISVLHRLYAEHHRSVEEIAVALDRSVATIRLRIHTQGFRRDGNITRLVRKHPDLAPILSTGTKEEFLAAVDRKVEGRKTRNSKQFEAKKTEVSAKIAEICGGEGSRNEKIRLMRLAGANLSQIGDVFGISRERVRQIEAVGFQETPADRRGANRKIHETKPHVLNAKIKRLCRAWNAASREAKVMFLRAAPYAIFNDLTIDEVARASAAEDRP